MLKALTIAKNQCVGQRRPLGSIQVTIWSLAVSTLWVKMNYGATLMSLLVHTHTHTKQTCTSSTGQGPLHLLVHTHITDVHILHGPGASTLVGAHIHKTERAHPPRARGLHKQETGKCSVSAQWSMRWPGLGRDMTIRKSDLYFTSFVQCSLQHSWETLRILPLS